MIKTSTVKTQFSETNFNERPAYTSETRSTNLLVIISHVNGFHFNEIHFNENPTFTRVFERPAEAFCVLIRP